MTGDALMLMLASTVLMSSDTDKRVTTGLTVNGGAKTVLIPLSLTTEQMRMMYDDV